VTPGAEPGFTLDRFQVEAIEAIDQGRSVLVSAPTGSGKTVVAEHAVAVALAAGGRAFYTTPIKALSNQKYHDLVRIHGPDTVGLLTGDTSVNGDAPIVVMTTEVLRNMIYGRSDALDRLQWVVLDEVHYLQDAYRGPVWEEVIVHLPAAVRLVCLSATVSNADEVAGWIETVRGPTSVVVEQTRPVSLDNWYLVEDRQQGELTLLPTLVDERANPDGSRFDTDPRDTWRRGGGGRPRRRFATPRRVDVVELLATRDLLPAIYFIFSRAACDDAVASCVDAGLRFTDEVERTRIRQIVEHHVEKLADGDLEVLGYDRWLSALEAGLAAHHAGMVPPFKEAVEACFVEGLVKVVFATETLALGINMPARTVVIEKLTKFTGERHESLTPGQYTQLTGRAGRRGIDAHGHAVVLWSPFVTFDEVAALAASRSFRLTSSFRPTYNMAANLVRRYRAEEAHRLLNLSFAQYQTDRDLVRLEHRRHRRAAEREELAREARCELGDVAEYAELVAAAAATPSPSRRAPVVSALEALRPGDVVRVDGLAGGRRGIVVLSVAHRKGGAVRVRGLTVRRRMVQLGVDDFDGPPEVLGRIRLPEPFTPTKPAFQKQVALALERFHPDASAPRPPLVDHEPAAPVGFGEHPVASCPDRETHLRALGRLDRLDRDLARMDQEVAARTGSLADVFDRVLQMLEAWGHLDGWALTRRGEQLVRIYHEADLVVAEALEEGMLDDVDAASLAGLASGFVYEHRNSGPELEAWFPDRGIARRAAAISELATQIAADERRLGLPETRVPDWGFSGLAHAWTAGDDLDHVLGDDDLSGGDFVRTIRQLLDLLRQVGDAAARPATATIARSAADDIHRGVVAASSAIATGDPGTDDGLGGVGDDETAGGPDRGIDGIAEGAVT
jgi:ATP-dependent RNA helicase HelY